VLGTPNTATGSDGTPTVSLPTNASGQLMLAVCWTEQNRFPTTPSGWTDLTNQQANPVLFSWYKWSTGGEASVASSQTGGVNWLMYATVFTGAHATTAPAGAESGTNDPPSLDPAGWGSEDTLWLALCNKFQFNITGTPAGYSLYVTSGTLGNIRYDIRGLELNASSEDPSTYSGSGDTFTATLAIRPAPQVDPFAVMAPVILGRGAA
jgi:hypothetical protein